MPMTPAKIRESARACAALLYPDTIAKRADPTMFAVHLSKNDSDEEEHSHIRFMCEEIERLVDPNVVDGIYKDRVEKAFRWLGFVQGYLWTNCMATIEDCAKMNMGMN